MQIVDITLKDKPPIKHFHATDLSKIIVLAGPNGVGKTRLIQQLINLLQNPQPDPSLAVRIAATSSDESTKWGKPSLSTLDQTGSSTLRQHLQKTRKRGQWKSSVVNFDSSRTFETIKALPAQWFFDDPFQEDIKWNLLFSPLKNRYQDTIHALFKQIGHYRSAIAKKYEQHRKDNKTHMPIDQEDPLKKYKDMFRLLLSPKELEDIPLENPKIQYVEAGQLLAIEALSSGEREVFTIVFDLLLHEPHDCIIFFDEPEMHLHPELSFRLFKALENVGERNQYIFCTHSPDIITESLDHSVIFIKPPNADDNQAVSVRKEDEKAVALNLLGQNLGVIALGRRVILIEGRETSVDKHTYGGIVGSLFPQYVLVPVGPRRTILSFSRIIDDVLSKALWGIHFFMITDRDSSVPDDVMEQMVLQASGRLAFLPRYHLENYFLDENIIAGMFESMEGEDSWLRNSGLVREKLKRIARESISYATQLWLRSHLRSSVGEIELTVKGIDKMGLSEYTVELEKAIVTEHGRVSKSLSIDTLKRVVEERWNLLVTLIDEDKDEWKELIPGKIICQKFSAEAGVGVGRFRSMYINEARRDEFRAFEDVINIFEKFNSLS